MARIRKRPGQQCRRADEHPSKSHGNGKKTRASSADISPERPRRRPGVSAEKISLELRQALEEYDISQAELARELGWSEAKLSRIVAGRIPLKPHVLDEIAEGIGIDPLQLFHRVYRHAYPGYSRRQILTQVIQEHCRTPHEGEAKKEQELADLVDNFIDEISEYFGDEA